MKLYGLFQKRIDGDDALLSLLQRHFEAQSLAAEIYVENVDALLYYLGFTPMDQPVIVHLPREASIHERPDRHFLREIIEAGGSKVGGFITHDSMAVEENAEHVISALRQLQDLLGESSHPYQLFYEYAVGADPEAYCQLFHAIRDLPHISACIDVGHVGIRTVRAQYRKLGGERDACAWRAGDAGLKQELPLLQEAVAAALPETLKMIRSIGSIDKPLHFHIHDGHPLSDLSPYGVSDHLSFCERIPLPCKHKGRDFVKTMYGPGGLRKIVETIRSCVVHPNVSATLEIHESGRTRALGEDADLFEHWHLTENAEKMREWIHTIEDNAALLREALSAN